MVYKIDLLTPNSCFAGTFRYLIVQKLLKWIDSAWIRHVMKNRLLENSLSLEVQSNKRYPKMHLLAQNISSAVRIERLPRRFCGVLGLEIKINVKIKVSVQFTTHDEWATLTVIKLDIWGDLRILSTVLNLVILDERIWDCELWRVSSAFSVRKSRHSNVFPNFFLFADSILFNCYNNKHFCPCFFVMF